MALRLPVDFVAEYRGVKPAGQFTRRDTGEVVDIPAKLKFEITYPDGDVDLAEVSAASLEKIQGLDPTKFDRGQVMHLRGEVMIQDRGSDRASYFTVHSIAPADGQADGAKPKLRETA